MGWSTSAFLLMVSESGMQPKCPQISCPSRYTFKIRAKQHKIHLNAQADRKQISQHPPQRSSRSQVYVPRSNSTLQQIAAICQSTKVHYLRTALGHQQAGLTGGTTRTWLSIASQLRC